MVDLALVLVCWAAWSVVLFGLWGCFGLRVHCSLLGCLVYLGFVGPRGCFGLTGAVWSDGAGVGLPGLVLGLRGCCGPLGCFGLLSRFGTRGCFGLPGLWWSSWGCSVCRG